MNLFDSTASAGQRDTSAFRLLKLVLRNFKGIREFTLDAGGQNISVFGENATGKTTLFDAFAWLLFGKDSSGATDFAIKPLDADGQPIHNLETSVEGVFQIQGKTTVFRKVFAEKWTKKRGSAKSEFTGHTTDHYIDGVPVQKKDYDAVVAEIAREDIFKLLTSPTFFNENLHWQERRKILLEVCGDLTDAEVIAADKSLSRLPEILRGRRLDDHRKVIAARRAEINKELEKIPVRIDEAQRSLPDVSGIDPAKLSEDIEKAKAAQQQKREELARIESGGEVAELQKRLREVEAELLRIENTANALYNEAMAEKRRALGDMKSQADDLRFKLRAHANALEIGKQSLARLEKQMADLREAWHAENAREFAFEQSSACPTCGQALPEEYLVAAREKAQADFNRMKAERLEQISAEGKARKVEVDRIAAENERSLSELAALQAELAAKEAEIRELEAEVNNATVVTPVGSLEYEKKSREKDELEARIRELRSGNALALEAVRREINSYGLMIEGLEKTRLKLEQYHIGQKRIEELKAQEKALAAEFERLEGELYLTEEFIRAKVRMLEERINSRFKLARFKLFDVQVNGGVVECCETLYGGVPYSGGLNNGARINVGLDICNVLAEHYGFAPVLFVDNAEAVTELIPTRGQMIRLVVSGEDKKLRVEVE